MMLWPYSKQNYVDGKVLSSNVQQHMCVNIMGKRMQH